MPYWTVTASESTLQARRREEEEDRKKPDHRIRLWQEYAGGDYQADELRIEGGALLFITDGEIREAFGPTAWIYVRGPFTYPDV